MIYVETGKEFWKRVYLNGEKSDYKVSTHGRIKNTKTNHILSPRKHSSGYLQVDLYMSGEAHRFYIHRLVMLTFDYINNCENLQVNHIDGDKKNNYLYNLEWCTNSENQKHAHATGLKRHIYGDMRPRAKFTNEEIIQICEYMKLGYSNKYITEKFNIKDKELLSDIRNKRRWADVTKDFTFEKYDMSGENNPSAKYKEKDIHIICKELSNGTRPIDIHKKYGYSTDVISKIKRRKNWPNVTKYYDY